MSVAKEPPVFDPYLSGEQRSPRLEKENESTTGCGPGVLWDHVVVACCWTLGPCSGIFRELSLSGQCDLFWVL